MILLALFLAQADVYASTHEEDALCNAHSDQPYRFCLADRKHERAEKLLADALVKARHAARVQKQEIARFSRTNGGVTLDGDPMSTLESSQRAWERSYRADCQLAGLASATGSAGTEGVTVNWQCEADRILDRVQFLNKTYSIKE